MCRFIQSEWTEVSFTPLKVATFDNSFKCRMQHSHNKVDQSFYGYMQFSFTDCERCCYLYSISNTSLGRRGAVLMAEFIASSETVQFIEYV